MSPKYKIGDEVQCVSDPSRIGTVVEICANHAGMQWYRVNFGASGRPKMSEVGLRPFIDTDKPFDNLLKGNIDGYQEFQRLMTYQRLLRDHPLKNNIYAFNASRTRFFLMRSASSCIRKRSGTRAAYFLRSSLSPEYILKTES